MNESRIFWLKDDADAPGENEKTVFLASPDALPSAPRLSIRELFSKHYQQIREWLAAANRPGVALVVLVAYQENIAVFLFAITVVFV